jgi:hypothetical protein
MSQRYLDWIRQARRDLEMDYYTRAEAERAVEYAQRIIAFCENQLV